MNYGPPHGAPHDEMTMSAMEQYAPAYYAEYPYPPPVPAGGGFTLEQAQWLIQFMRNLPGGAPPEPTDAEYEQALAAQRAQAEGMPYAFDPTYGELPPYGYDE